MEKFDICATAALCEPAGLRISPNGKYAVYSRGTVDYESDCRGSDLFVLDLENGKERQFTFDSCSGGAMWNDAETILFQTDRRSRKQKEGTCTTFYRIGLNGGEAKEAFSIPLAIMDMQNLGNGLWLILSSESCAPKEWEKSGKWKMIDEYPYRSNGRGYIDGTYGKLYLFHEKTEKTEAVTDDSQNVTRILTTAGSVICYSAGDRTEPLRGFHQSLYQLDLKTGRKICVFNENDYAVGDTAYLRGRLWLALMTDGPDVQLSCFDMASMLPDGSDFRIEHKAEWLYGGMSVIKDELYTIRGWKAQMRLYRGSAFDESDRCLTDGELDVCELCCENGEVIFTGRKGNGLREIYRLVDGKAVRLTARSDAFLQKYCLSVPQQMTAAAADGTEIPFWVMEPTEGNCNEKRPAVLSIHGGPDGLYDAYLNPLHQAFAAAGYYVIFCNPRGSLTYGREFMKIKGGCGVQDYEDLMLCVDTALENVQGIDEGRLYVTGSSYGGYMTNWMICHTNRFSAAAPRVSVSNWISLRGTSDYKELCDWMHGATPWEDSSGLWMRSPLRWADQVNTPTIFVQHSEDYRCPMEQAEQMYTALVERGVEARLLINLGASHFNMSPQQEKYTFEQMIDWFGRHRKGSDKDDTGKDTTDCSACK